MSQDSAASHPDFHIRNEYANVQYRINGLLLPDGVSGLGPILDSGFIGSLQLLTGTLPAQYGLRTSGVLDITTRDFATAGGEVSIYGGSHGVIQPRLDYGTASGNTQIYVNLSGFRGNVGIENPTPSYDPIHDRTEQGKALGYLSQTLGDTARFTFIAGASASHFQIPNIPGLQPLGDFGGPNVNSLALNENETDTVAYNLAALQTSDGPLDTQLSVFTRYARVHFVPDSFTDLAFNDVSSDVARRSWLGGLAGDAAYKLDARQTIRAGFDLTGEQTNNDSILTALRLNAAGDPTSVPVTFTDNNAKLGINAGGYLQDEIKLADPADAEPRPALRPALPIRDRKPAEPARRARLQARRGDDPARRLRALFHAAEPGGSGELERRAGAGHDPAARGSGSRIPRCPSARIMSMSASTARCCQASPPASTAITSGSPTSSTTASSARRRS